MRDVETKGEAVEFTCECGHLECAERFAMTVAEYQTIRAESTRFAVIPGHELPEVESVVERHPTYLVVEKRAKDAQEVARETDPRDLAPAHWVSVTDPRPPQSPRVSIFACSATSSVSERVIIASRSFVRSVSSRFAAASSASKDSLHVASRRISMLRALVRSARSATDLELWRLRRELKRSV